jgi:hypothetical protein
VCKRHGSSGSNFAGKAIVSKAETRIRPHPKHSGAILKKEKLPASGARNQSRSEAGELDVVSKSEQLELKIIVEAAF